MSRPRPLTIGDVGDVEDRLVSIAESRGLVWVNAGGYATLGTVEGIAHELAHLIDLDEDPGFERQLDAMGSAEANEREASTLRVEVAGLARLGVRLSMRRLWASGNWRDPGAPALRALRSPLTSRERRLVARFVSLVVSEEA